MNSNNKILPASIAEYGLQLTCKPYFQLSPVCLHSLYNVLYYQMRVCTVQYYSCPLYFFNSNLSHNIIKSDFFSLESVGKEDFIG